MSESSMQRKWNNLPVRIKTMLIFLMPMLLILFMNIYMYVSINATIEEVNQIYVTNVNLNDLSSELTNLQNSMREYLENKGTSSLNSYYMAEQGYRNAIDNLSSRWTDLGMEAMQENIIRQSDNYFKVAAETIQAKRGRIVEKYKSGYEESLVLYSDLQNCIYSLNSERFKTNTSNYSSLLSSLRHMEFFTIIVLIMIGIISIIIVTMMTRAMTMPLTELSIAADEVSKGNFDVDIAILDGNDEISVVSATFSQMVNSIQRYIAEIRESMRRESELKEHELVMSSRMKEVQLRNLQAQINPHFLFNTLNAGSQLAMMEGADKTVEFIDNMADFFRYNIKKINNDASLEEELTMVNRYVYILNVRFTGDIHYSQKVDPEVLAISVPSMILQPIVENAVNYGIRNIDWEGHIDLSAYIKDNWVHISIKDNGIGMSQDKIDRILNGEMTEEVDDSNPGSNGVGLANVIERLRIFTGVTDVMEIHSEGENKGTQFIIKVPRRV